MKTGISLVDMATQLEANRKVARDFVADTRKLELIADVRTKPRLLVEGAGTFELSNVAKRQLGDKLQIPAPFFDRLEGGHPDILADMVNKLFQREPGQHMVRTLPGVARAVLSNVYRPLDNYDLFGEIFPMLKKAGAIVESSSLTETKMYLKVRCPWLDRELPVPEGLKMGVGHNFFVRKIEGSVTISNSDVGHGGIQILPGVYENQCTNYATFKNAGTVKIHIGKKTQSDDLVIEYLSDKTKQLDDAAFWSKVRDNVTAIMDGRAMDGMVKQLTAARSDLIVGSPAAVVEVFSKQQRLTEEEAGGLLKHLVGAGEMTRYGLQWAVTRLAQDVADYDRASEFERLGGQVIEMPQAEWAQLAKAA